MIFQSYGVEVGIKNQSKIHQKLKPKMDGLLALIFGGFWWVLGGKLGWKIETRTQKKQLKHATKMMNKNMPFGRAWGEGSSGAPMRAQGFWDPLITNSQRQHHTTVHRPQPTGLKNY